MFDYTPKRVLQHSYLQKIPRGVPQAAPKSSPRFMENRGELLPVEGGGGVITFWVAVWLGCALP